MFFTTRAYLQLCYIAMQLYHTTKDLEDDGIQRVVLVHTIIEFQFPFRIEIATEQILLSTGNKLGFYLDFTSAM